MSFLRELLSALQKSEVPTIAESPVSQDAKFKHLEFIQATIARMANNSFLFKGWAITIATGLAAFAAFDTRRALLAIALITTVLFWGLDGYYLWLERGFVNLHRQVAKKRNDQIDFNMAVNKQRAFRRWLRTCLRWHLILFYGSIIIVDVIGIVLIKGGK